MEPDEAARWWPAAPAMRFEWPLPRCEPEDLDACRRVLRPPAFPELGVAVLPDAEVFSRQGLPRRGDCLLTDLADGWRRPDDVSMVIDALRFVSRPVRRIRGRVLNLASPWAFDNFAHTVLDGLGRLEIFFRAGRSLRDVDAVIIPPFQSAEVRRYHAKLGLEAIPRYEAGLTRWLCDELWQPSFPGVFRWYSPVVPEMYRRRVQAPGRRRRRLYLQRRSSRRRLLNESDLRHRLVACGFEVIEPQSAPAPEARFADAAVIVAEHGAALAGLVFCPPGAVVLEIVSDDHLWPYFYSLAAAGGLRSHWCIARFENRRRFSRGIPRHADATLDLEKFDRCLAAALAETSFED